MTKNLQNRSKFFIKEKYSGMKIKLFILLLLICSGNRVGGQSINIDAQNKKQFINMMGGDMERSGANLQSAVNKDSIIKWVIEDIPFNTFRVKYDKIQEMEEGVKDWDSYSNDVLTMKMILAANPDIKFFATMKSDYHGYSEGNRNNLPTFIYDYEYNSDGTTSGTKSFDVNKYGVFLADYLEFMEDQGVPISYLSISKEWVQVLNATRSKATIEKLISECGSRGITLPFIIDACTWSISQGVNVANNYVSNGTNQYIYGYSAHNYWSNDTKTWDDFVTAANTGGKFAIADETGHGGGGLTNDIESEFNNLLGTYKEKSLYYAGGIEGECIFEIWPRGFNEVNSKGYYAKPIFFNGDIWGRRMRSYYVMQKFAKEAVDATYISSSFNQLNGVSTMVFSKDNQLALWVINQSNEDYSSVDVNISSFNLKSGMEVYQTYWDSTSVITGAKHTLSANDGSLDIAVNARSISCYVVSRNCVLTPYYKMDSGEKVKDSLVFVQEGSSLILEPESSIEGSWTWSGPNGFTGSTQSISLSNMSSAIAGNYVATFDNSAGLTKSLTMSLYVNCTLAPTVTPYLKINNEALSNTSLATVDAGSTILLQPTVSSTGTWLWSGPNGLTSTSSEINLSAITPEQAGDYIGIFTSDDGCTQTLTYVISVTCNSISISPSYQVNDLTYSGTSISANTTDNIELTPSSFTSGTWRWVGPCDYSATDNNVTISSISSFIAGDYIATLTDFAGCSQSVTYSVDVACPSVITRPYYQIDGGSWAQSTTVKIDEGSSIKFGPQPVNGSWNWIGPNGFSASTREITLTNLTPEESGSYVATYVGSYSCDYKISMDVTVDEITGIWNKKQNNSYITIYPNPSEDGNVKVLIDGEPHLKTAHVKVVDFAGKQVYYEQKEIFNGEIDLDASLNNGIYLITIVGNKQVKSGKLVVR